MHSRGSQTTSRLPRHHPVALGLHAFTLPLVIGVIKEIGPPSAIALVPREKQRGPLLVTLATELACVLVSILREHLGWGGCIASSEDADALKLGAGYMQASQRLKALFEKERDALEAAHKIERLILRLAAGEIVDRATGTDVSPCPDGGFLRWFKNDACTPERRRRYETYSQDFSRLKRQIKVTDSNLAKMRAEALKNDVGGQPAELRIDFSASYHALQDGAAAILVQTDRAWWGQWTEKIEKEISRTFPNRGAVAMLRDLHLNRMADIEYLFGSMSYEGIWTYLLATPSTLPVKCLDFLAKHTDRLKNFLNKCFPDERGDAGKQVLLLAESLRGDADESRELRKEFTKLCEQWSKDAGSELLVGPTSSNLQWPAHTVHKRKKTKGAPLSTEAVTDFRKLLAAQDAMVEAWLDENAGAYHPCRWTSCRDQKSRQRGKAVDQKASKIKRQRESYPVERAENELYFCLSRDKVQFAPSLSHTFAMKRWAAWVEEARCREPEYWEPSK
jgi:hypothetical protein